MPEPVASAVFKAAETLKPIGLRSVSITQGEGHGLRLTCWVVPEVEYEYEPTHQIGVSLMEAAMGAGGWVEALRFSPEHQAD